MKRSGFKNSGSGFKKTGSSLQTRSGLKTRTTLKARKPMNKVGRVGRANMAANKKIAVIAKKEGLDYCEIGRLGLKEMKDIECLGAFTLASAHKHKRAHYKGDADLLSDKKEWVKACVNCHDAIEHNKALTEFVFKKLR